MGEEEVVDMGEVVEVVDMVVVDMAVVEDPEKSTETRVITYERLTGASTLYRRSRRTFTAPPPA